MMYGCRQEELSIRRSPVLMQAGYNFQKNREGHLALMYPSGFSAVEMFKRRFEAAAKPAYQVELCLHAQALRRKATCFVCILATHSGCSCNAGSEELQY